MLLAMFAISCSMLAPGRVEATQTEATQAGAGAAPTRSSPRLVDWSRDAARQVLVDKEEGVYLGHVSTLLLDDGRTILAAYPKGHGRGAIVLKKSPDGGRTWSERLPTPASFATSLEVPTLFRVVGADGRRRIILWSGLHPARYSLSEDEGASWSELKPAGDWGGIVVMGDLVPAGAPGRHLAFFHDDGRYFKAPGAEDPRKRGVFDLYQVESLDGGATWGAPRSLHASSTLHLCEPGAVRSDDGSTLLLLMRENARRAESHWIASRDEGANWSAPSPAHPALTGDRHTIRRAKDGRLVVAYRDMNLAQDHPWKGDFVAWIGTFEDLVAARPGQAKVRLLDNQDSWDCGYPGLEALPDGTFVATTYGHWEKGAKPWIASVRFDLSELEPAPGASAPRK